MRPLPFVLAVAAGSWLAGTSATAQQTGQDAVQWPQFRGPGGLGIAADAKKLPIHFGPEKNVVWKTPLPPGHSSPCIWDERILLTAFDESAQKLETFCLDRNNGRILWRQVAPADKIENFHPAGSPAVATPATDGQRVYVYFGSYGLLCYDFDGNEQWKKPLPFAESFQGTGTSPIVAGELLLLHREFPPDPSLMAVNCRTGETVWKQAYQLASLAGPNNGYSTPVLWRHNGVEEVIIHSPTRVTAHDLNDGTERWSIRTSSTACTTPVIGDGLLFVVGYWVGTEPGESDPLPTFDDLLKRADKDKDNQISKGEFPDDLDLFRRPEATGLPGTNLSLKFLFDAFDPNHDSQVARKEWDTFLEGNREISRSVANGLLAIRPGGSGNVTATHVLWREKRSLPEVPSPLHYRERIYLVRDGGIASCLEARDGRLLYRARLTAGGPYFASPVAGDGKVYAASRDGVVVVFAAGDKLQVLARNDLGELISATPAPVNGMLYVRTEKHLYAFGE
jgi:outer membrane protein assembly factor BamB